MPIHPGAWPHRNSARIALALACLGADRQIRADLDAIANMHTDPPACVNVWALRGAYFAATLTIVIHVLRVTVCP